MKFTTNKMNTWSQIDINVLISSKSRIESLKYYIPEEGDQNFGQNSHNLSFDKKKTKPLSLKNFD